MGVEIISKDDNLLKDLTRDFDANVTKALEIAAQDFVAQMIDRTLAGKDVDGAKFAEYQGAYKEQIQKYGKVRVGKNQFKPKSLNPVNLTLSGQMLESIQTRALRSKRLKGIEVFMNQAQSKKAQGIQFGNKFIKKKREFFAVSDKESAKFVETFKNQLRIIKND